MEAFTRNPFFGFSLVPVWVLVGLFEYLRSFTGNRHFRTWTSGWLFYALFLTLSVVPEGSISAGALIMCKNWCLATGALLMLWGSFQFINAPTKQRLIAMMVVFNLMWSYAISDKLRDGAGESFPAFAFLALASGFTAFCIFSRRTRQAQRGATLLTIGFGLWSIFLLCSPLLTIGGVSHTAVYAGFMAGAVVQLFIAISMMVLVLEETRGKLQQAVGNFGREVDRSGRLQVGAEEANEKFRALFENSKEAAMIVSEDALGILDLNSAARRLFGLREKGEGLSLRSYCMLPNQRQSDLATLRGALTKNAELDLALPDGPTVRSRVRSHSIHHEGQPARFVVFSDVAERAHLGRQLRGGGKMSALGQIISGVAHELNNPLAAIKGYTDLLLLTAQVDAQTRSALLKVSQESNRAARLVRDLVSFARPEAPVIEPLNVKELLERLVEQRRTDLQARGIELQLDARQDTALALGSGEQIQQVLAHLLNNAVDALDEVEGERTILISARTADAKIELRIEDSGPGIDPDVAPRIFEPFFTTKPVGTGTGLGLSVCYSILLQHRGNISFEPSTLGGACFVVTIPAAYTPVSTQSNIANVEFRPRNRTARLLVVDDEPSVGALLNDMLTLLGHQVTVDVSPFNALARIDSQEFDAVLSDFRMPGMNGGELYAKAVEINKKYQHRFLFLTGDMMDPNTHRFFQSNKVRCLLKPFQLSALQSALAEILEEADQTSSNEAVS